MILILSFVTACLLIMTGRKQFKDRPVVCYLIAALAGAASIAAVWSMGEMPDWIIRYVIPVFARGGLAGSLFLIVMWTGALPQGSQPIKFLMPIRGELSILACILTLAHNIAYGKVYFVRLFQDIERMPLNQILAALCSIAMLVIMLPLFLTSFKSIRRKMKGKSWKRLQRGAYAFYGLMYLHVMLLNLPSALEGNADSVMNSILYTAVCGSYLVCRVGKAVMKKRKLPDRYRGFQLGVLTLTVALSGISGWLWGVGLRDSDQELPVQNVASRQESSAQTSLHTADDTTSEGKDRVKIWKDGIYEGSAQGYDSEITVEVTIVEGQIADIQIKDEAEDLEYLARAKKVVRNVLEQGSVEGVDTVSGATFTSKGILDAVENALLTAEGGE